MVLIAGQSVGQLGADLSADGSPVLVNLSASDSQAVLKAQAGTSLNVYGLHGLRLGGVTVADGNGLRGDARIYALEDILNGTAPGQAALTARNAWLGTLSGGIGGAAQPLLTDLSGYLIALAQGPWRSASWARMTWRWRTWNRATATRSA